MKKQSTIFKMMLSASILAIAPTAMAQDAEGDEVIATGIIQSLENAIVEKRNADNIKEIIQAEDIGKLPDQNLAEVLENITGIQITREAGVGAAVQIRGTDANRTEINGVSTVGSGFGRSGINFQDIPASLVSSLEVIKVPEAKTIEGSVGGTINLRTLRPLELNERVMAFRAQLENSDLADATLPRFSGTIGNNWTNSKGQEFGVVFSGSYTQNDVAEFRPRADRDAVILADSSIAAAEDFDFLRLQFVQQNYDNFEFETLNLNGSLEYSPKDGFRFYVDGTFNDQERRQESTTIDFSGVSNGAVVASGTNSTFETIDFGTIDGPNGPIDLGSVQAVSSGFVEPARNVRNGRADQLDPNLRVVTRTGARVTESAIFRTGLDWEKDRLSGTVEVSTSSSETESPNFQPRLEFVNPNFDQPSLENGADNGVPVEFDFRNGTLQFGIAQGLPTTPTTEQLLDPANYRIGRVDFTENSVDARESAIRFDFSYDMEDKSSFLTSIDAGYRFNTNNLERRRGFTGVNYTSDTSIRRPSADQFASVITPGPDNFDAADGRRLFVGDFLTVNPSIAFSDPQRIINAINQAVRTQNQNPNLEGRILPLIGEPTENATDFFEIGEDTHAIYLQANFDLPNMGMPIRGNIGARWIDTTLKSESITLVTGGGLADVENKSSYDFFLPRFNVVANATDDILIRGGIARDIRRPDFNDLSTAVSFGTGSNTVVAIGNPDLVPEDVWSYDLAAEYYFSPSSLISIGFFHKDRSNLFTDIQEDPPGNLDENNQLNIDITPPCEEGGIFNPIANRNINNPDTSAPGICVPFRTSVNGEGNFTQTGIEVAFQYDLSEWEDRLGWASGFGVIANYTYQKRGGSAEDFASNFRRIGGNRNIFGVLGVQDPLQQVVQPNLSENAYNATLFYDKYGLSARARYTWRSEYSLPASVESFKAGAPVVNADRGQLNASVSYDINDNINIGIEGINLTQADQKQFCVKEGTLFCFNGFTDRRLIAGVNMKF